MKKGQNSEQQIKYQFELIQKLVNKLLIDNMELKSGYYYKFYPKTKNYVENVLYYQVEHVISCLDKLENTINKILK
jgi:hypothetical protein